MDVAAFNAPELDNMPLGWQALHGSRRESSCPLRNVSRYCAGPWPTSRTSTY